MLGKQIAHRAIQLIDHGQKRGHGRHGSQHDGDERNNRQQSGVSQAGAGLIQAFFSETCDDACNETAEAIQSINHRAPLLAANSAARAWLSKCGESQFNSARILLEAETRSPMTTLTLASSGR